MPVKSSFDEVSSQFFLNQSGTSGAWAAKYNCRYRIFSSSQDLRILKMKLIMVYLIPSGIGTSLQVQASHFGQAWNPCSQASSKERSAARRKGQPSLCVFFTLQVQEARLPQTLQIIFSTDSTGQALLSGQPGMRRCNRARRLCEALVSSPQKSRCRRTRRKWTT